MFSGFINREVLSHGVSAIDFVGTVPSVLANITDPFSNIVMWTRTPSAELEAYTRELAADHCFEPAFDRYFQACKGNRYDIYMANERITGLEHQSIPLKDSQTINITFSRALLNKGFSHLIDDIRDIAHSIIDSTTSPVTFHATGTGTEDDILRYVSESQSRFGKRHNYDGTDFHMDGTENPLLPSYKLPDPPDNSVTFFTVIVNYLGPTTRYLGANFYNAAIDALRQSPATKIDTVTHSIARRHPFSSVVRQVDRYAAVMLSGVHGHGEDKYAKMTRVCCIHAPAEYQRRHGKRLTLVLRGHIGAVPALVA